MPDLQGQRLQERYLVGDPAARGPHATIYRATVLDSGDTVAVKGFDALAHRSPRFIAQFRDLSRQARAVDNPHVVPMFAYGQSGGTYYQVTEWTGAAVPGEISLDGAVRLGAIIDLGIEAAAGLVSLHAGGLIHGHLKPSNIRQRLGGSVAVAGAGEPQLLDARVLAQGDPAGSAAYLSPEQILSQPLSPAVDLYAFGVILYRLTTGSYPFTGPDTATMLRNQLEERPVSPQALNSVIDPQLDALITRLLAREPDNRPSSASALYDQLVALRPLYPESVPALAASAPAGEAESRRGWMARLFRGRPGAAAAQPRTDGTESSAPSLID